MNVFFVCSLNHARSIVAERMYRRTPGLCVRSGGIDARARHQVDERDLIWADHIVVFEPAHERWIRDTFVGDLPVITDVCVPDDYTVEDVRLANAIRDALEPVLGEPGKSRGR